MKCNIHALDIERFENILTKWMWFSFRLQGLGFFSHQRDKTDLLAFKIEVLIIMTCNIKTFVGDICEMCQIVKWTYVWQPLWAWYVHENADVCVLSCRKGRFYMKMSYLDDLSFIGNIWSNIEHTKACRSGIWNHLCEWNGWGIFNQPSVGLITMRMNNADTHSGCKLVN